MNLENTWCTGRARRDRCVSLESYLFRFEIGCLCLTLTFSRFCSTCLYALSEGDFDLANSERKRLDSNVWSCPIVLQRYGAPIHTKSECRSNVVQETCQLLSVLKSAFHDFKGPITSVNKPVKYWDIVVRELCLLSTTVEEVDPELVKKVLMLRGAFEKELDMLRTTNEVIEFASVSRWLDWTFLREMTKEKKKAWRSGALHRGEVEWKSRVGFSEERYLRTKGREMEWWDVVHDMNEHEILKLITKYEDRGIRLGLSVNKNDGGSTEISFQGQRSTVDPRHIIAYIELLARFVSKAESYDTRRLAEQLEDFQLHRLAIPRERFELMLSFVTHITSDTEVGPRDILLTRLLLAFGTASPLQFDSGLPLPRSRWPRMTVDPFYDLRKFVEAHNADDRKDMALFMERYERAGGYTPTTEEKLLAILGAEEEEERRTRNEGREQRS